MKLWGWGRDKDGVLFSLNKPQPGFVNFACINGKLAVGNGANNLLVPQLVDPQCEILQGFMPDVFAQQVQMVCAPIGDCAAAAGNCFANLADCQAAPWGPVPGWDADPNAGEDPLAPWTPPLPPPSSSSGSSCGVQFSVNAPSAKGAPSNGMFSVCCPSGSTGLNQKVSSVPISESCDLLLEFDNLWTCYTCSSAASSSGSSGGGSSSVSSDEYYCLLLQSGSSVSSGGSGGGGGSEECSATDGSGSLLYPVMTPVCDGLTSDCIYLKETYSNGCPKMYGCGCNSGGVCADCGSPFMGSLSSSYLCVTSAELPSYEGQGIVIAGPYSASECNSGCGQGGGEVGGGSSSGSSVLSSSVSSVASSSSSAPVQGDGGGSGLQGSSSSVGSGGSSVSSGDGGGGDGGGGGGGGATYVCVKPRSAGFMSSLDVLPALSGLVPSYTQSSLDSGCYAAGAGEMTNGTGYDSSYAVYQTMTQTGGYNWVLADYGVVGSFQKVRVGPPPCRLHSGMVVGAANGAVRTDGLGCDGSYYLGSLVEYSEDGVVWHVVGSTTAAPFLNSFATSVGTELVGDGTVKSARYIRVVGAGLRLGLSELHAADVQSGSGGVSSDYMCILTSEFNPAQYDFVSGVYSGSAACLEVCGVSSSSSSEFSSSSSEFGSSVSSGGGDGGSGGSSVSSGDGVSSSVSSGDGVSSSVSSGDGGGTGGGGDGGGSGGGVGSASSSSSGVSTSSSSGDCSSGLGASLVTVLDANPDLEGYYYGEDALNGWIAATYEAVELRYDALGSDGLPISVNVSVGSDVVGTLVFPPAYEGTSFAMVYRGVVYCGVLSSSDIAF